MMEIRKRLYLSLVSFPLPLSRALPRSSCILQHHCCSALCWMRIAPQRCSHRLTEVCCTPNFSPPALYLPSCFWGSSGARGCTGFCLQGCPYSSIHRCPPRVACATSQVDLQWSKVTIRNSNLCCVLTTSINL